jgi:hypothetical protein
MVIEFYRWVARGNELLGSITLNPDSTFSVSGEIIKSMFDQWSEEGFVDLDYFTANQVIIPEEDPLEFMQAVLKRFPGGMFWAVEVDNENRRPS